MKEADIISTEEVTQCLLCGSKDKEVLHAGLVDPMLGAPGEWTLKKCRLCGLVFLDPRPTLEDIGKAYSTYYTHAAKQRPSDFTARLRRYVRGGFLATKLGYDNGVSTLQRIVGSLAYLHPEEREMILSTVMYLPAERRGRVLDVGSGNGEMLKDLRRFGWEAHGVDFDEKAVKSARQNYGLDVRLGTLEEQGYPENAFDAVIVSHVIEHVHDPVALLDECRRILRPGGVLVVITPNVASLAHRRYRTSWSSLHPPRHLALFTRHTLTRTAQKAGFSEVGVIVTVRGAYGISIDSHRISKRQDNVGQPPGSLTEKLRGHLFQYAEWMTLRLGHDVGEELLMTAVKDRP